jgi:hypothetical protein
MAENKKWANFYSRTAKKIANNLGVISADQGDKVKKCRSDKLAKLDAYYDGEQYDHLMPWDEAVKQSCDDKHYVPIRERKPRIQLAFAKMLSQRIASKLVGRSNFPTLSIEDDPDTTQFIQLVLKVSKFKAEILEPMRRNLAAGSAFIRFWFVDGVIKMESYLSKYCYPVFDPVGNLSSVTIKYVFSDPEDLDDKGKPLRKWFKIELTDTVDIEYDNPIYSPTTEPVFQEAGRAEHGLGYVQGQWFRTSKNKHVPDGYSLHEDILDFIDELNYSLSQSSTAVSYNQDPQLALKGMDVDELDGLIRSSAKAWNLGRDGEANFLETSMTGVQVAAELRDKLRLNIQDIARIVMLDPEKIVGSAQSGKAMEVLHGPMVELIDEIRPMVEDDIIGLLIKISMTYLILMAGGVETGLEIPAGWKPSSFNIMAVWPPVFPQTIQDLQQKVTLAVAVSGGNILSRETMTRWLAKDFDVEDIEAEIAKIAAQPIINPFGAF